jgi:hypothetical protein
MDANLEDKLEKIEGVFLEGWNFWTMTILKNNCCNFIGSWIFFLRMIFVIKKIHNIFVNITKLINCFQIYGLLAFWRSIYN